MQSHERRAQSPMSTHTAEPNAEQRRGASPGKDVQLALDSGGKGHDGPTNTIVDDPKDPRNAERPGTGKGVLKDSQGKVHTSTTVFGGLRNDCGTKASGLVFPGDSMAGTEPEAGTWPDWWATMGPRKYDYWVRGHLLNHNLGGPGEKRNMTPITKKTNSRHHALVEATVKAAQARGDLISYDITATYSGSGPANLKGDDYDPAPEAWKHLPTGLICKYETVNAETNKVTSSGHSYIANTRN